MQMYTLNTHYHINMYSLTYFQGIQSNSLGGVAITNFFSFENFKGA